MRERNKNPIIRRYLNEKDAIEYTSLGRGKVRRWGESIGAVRHIGKRIVYDRDVIDEALAAQ